MNPRLAGALAIVAAVAIAAAAYFVGVRGGSMVADTPAMMAAPPAMSTPMTRTAALSESERADIEAVVRDYLMANPEVIRDAINELQRKQTEAEQAEQVKAITDNGDLIFSSTRQVVLGNPDGDVTLVEFFDYNCGFCKRAHADMKRLIEEDPGLRIVLKEFPVLGDGSVQAAQVAVAVQMTAPEKYGEFHDILISETGGVDGERALAVAEEIGLDRTALRAKVESPDVKATLDEVYLLAGELNLTGTPSYVTSKEVVVGAVGYEALKAKIADARAGN